MRGALCIHGHFYQPPRENPWTELLDEQPSAAPFHDWNERITDECYRANSRARIMAGAGLPDRTINNYAFMSFDFGPTLLRYLAREQRDVYAAVLAADAEGRERFGGHGPAIAQSYSHAILPLACDRDRRTEIRWGLRDFELRFGRKSEGIWLPEAAVDTPTLEALVDEGVRFTVLAQRQAAQVREPGGAWRQVGATSGMLDTRRPYLVRLPSDRTIAVFLYDGGLAHDVAFGGALSDGAAFLRTLEEAARHEGAGRLAATSPCLIHFATDGETFGHHHHFADMGLAWILESAALGRSRLDLTVYGRWLEQHPAVVEVRLHERSSWSCIHGVERWRSDCGCHAGRRGGGCQRWRGPLREALDDLRDRLGGIFEREGGALLTSPWEARDAYVELLVERTPESEREFLARHGRGQPKPRQRARIFELLEMQRHTLHMYASCAWFFDDLSDIEPLQGLAHAARAIELSGKAAEEIEQRFVAVLAQVRGNDGDVGDELYRRVVAQRRPQGVRAPGARRRSAAR
ncbi:MAG TPA: DUF3536 domain-containing protein [Candidatus Limnocylindrales bacterium]|nr:DUF3536 domain-containing protein [Candidatus Limnocylindrales bacterium]